MLGSKSARERGSACLEAGRSQEQIQRPRRSPLREHISALLRRADRNQVREQHHWISVEITLAIWGRRPARAMSNMSDFCPLSAASACFWRLTLPIREIPSSVGLFLLHNAVPHLKLSGGPTTPSPKGAGKWPILVRILVLSQCREEDMVIHLGAAMTKRE